MANYSTLKSNVASVVRTNGQNAITGANLQSTLYGMIESLGADYQLMGIATASTNPGSNIDQNIAYLATSGSSTVTFTHFLSSAQTPLSLAPNKFGVLRYNGTWSIQSADLPSGGGSSSPYIYNPNLANNTESVYSAADARQAAIDAGYWKYGVILVYKKGVGGYDGQWTVEVRAGLGTTATSDDEWEQIYPVDINVLVGDLVRGMVNIITYSSKITFTKSGSTWTVRIPAGTSVVIDGVDYGVSMIQSWSATCTPDLEDIGVVIYNVDTGVLSFEESSNATVGPRSAVLFTFCFSNSKCTLKDSDFSVTIP